jgi:hypothetical protein
MYRFKHLTRLITRRLQIWTDLGKLEFISNEDKTSLEFRASSSFKDETHPTKETWRVRHHIGAGDNIISTYVTEPLTDEDLVSKISTGNPFLYNNIVKPNGDKSEFSAENIKTNATKDILEESIAGNIKEKAAMNVESKAGLILKHEAMLIKNKADVSISNDATNIASKATLQLTTDALMQSHKATATFDINALSALTLQGGATATLASAIIAITGATTIAGPAIILAPAGGTPMPVVNGTWFELVFLPAYNAHLHVETATPGSSTTPPTIPIPSPVLTKTLIG